MDRRAFETVFEPQQNNLYQIIKRTKTNTQTQEHKIYVVWHTRQRGYIHGGRKCSTKITNATSIVRNKDYKCSSIALSIVALRSITFHTKKTLQRTQIESKNTSVGMSVQTPQFTSRLSTTPPYSSKHKVTFDYKSPHWLAFIYHPKEIDAANYTSLASMGAPPSNAITMGVHRESPRNARTCLEELVWSTCQMHSHQYES